MAINRKPRKATLNKRRGLASLEVVMTTAVMLPIAAAILFLGIKMAAIVYQVIGGLVAWPFL